MGPTLNAAIILSPTTCFYLLMNIHDLVQVCQYSIYQQSISSYLSAMFVPLVQVCQYLSIEYFFIFIGHSCAPASYSCPKKSEVKYHEVFDNILRFLFTQMYTDYTTI